VTLLAKRAWAGTVVWGVAAALGAVVAPLRTLQARGVALLAVHLADLLAVAALLWLCSALGQGALKRLRVAFPTSLDLLAFATTVGAGLLATELLLASAVLGVRPWIIGLVLALNAVAFGAELAESATTFGRLLGRRDQPRITCAGLGAAAAVLLVLALAPPSDWDSLTYHVLAPSRWLHDGRMSTLGGNEHVAFVGLVHLLYLPLLAVKSLSGPAILSAGLALILGVAAVSLARRLFGAASAAYTGVLMWGTPTILLVASTPKVDVSLALFLLLAHDALLTAWRDRSPRHLDLAAILLGFALGVKYQGGAYALALSPLILWIVVKQRGGLRPVLSTSLRFAGLALCAFAPWLVKNQILYGAPFYPFLAAHHTEPWLIPLLADGTTSITLDPRVFRIQQTARAEFNLRDAFLNPGALSIGGETNFYFLNPVLALAPFCLLAVRNAAVIGLVAPSLLYIVALLMVEPMSNPRYMIPGIVPLTIVSTAMIVAATHRLPRVPQRALRALVLLVCLIPTVGSMYLWISGNHAVPNLLGVTSGEQYLATHASPVVRSHVRVSAEANRLLAPGDTILMLFEGRGLYLNAPAIEDTKLTNWASLAAALGPTRCIERSGITHVLARPSAARYYELRGVPGSVLRLGDLERFAARCLTPLYSEPGVTLYVARPPR
jgi:4-amino-4-deoxy-L-arabinose transferase-like glycosyltransferase